jgi:hypothetical protein
MKRWEPRPDQLQAGREWVLHGYWVLAQRTAKSAKDKRVHREALASFVAILHGPPFQHRTPEDRAYFWNHGRWPEERTH